MSLILVLNYLDCQDQNWVELKGMCTLASTRRDRHFGFVSTAFSCGSPKWDEIVCFKNGKNYNTKRNKTKQ